MKTKDELAMQVRKEWDEKGWRWKLSLLAGGFTSEIYCYGTAEEGYFNCVRELVNHAYQMQSV
jgi:hypothetical protein